ncbi:lyase domain-containing protein [Sarocladium implicatum]|nr:lyase domain-containing protein [Sarocladium implicatum]
MAPSLDSINHEPHPNGNGNVKGNKVPLSEGRLTRLMSPLLQDWNEKPRLKWEIENLAHVLRVDQAHIVMLAEQKLLSKAHAAQLLFELRKLAEAGPDGLEIQPGFGNIVLQVEQHLASKLGEDIAGRLPIARSRLDQGPTLHRLVDREAILDVMNGAAQAQATLIEKAEEYRHVPMIHYTHLQQAQPANFGHWLLAFSNRLGDSLQRLRLVYLQTNRSPLGSVGQAGTDLPTSRHRTAELLGFPSVLENSRLGRDGYYEITIVFELAMIMTVLNDLCSDLHIFSSNEFRTVETDDSHCQTSSVFPHKKNPYALETIKTASASAHGWIATALALFRNEGTSDHASRSVGCLPEAFRVTRGMLQLMVEILDRMTVKEARWEELLSQAWVTTNRLGNILLTKYHMSYRTAHGVVARLVKKALDKGLQRDELTPGMLDDAAVAMGVKPINMTSDELRSSLEHREFINSIRSLGGVGPAEVSRLLSVAKEEQLALLDWIASREVYLADAESRLAGVVENLIVEGGIDGLEN